jgi:hypothetical protein
MIASLLSGLDSNLRVFKDHILVVRPYLRLQILILNYCTHSWD